MTTHGDAIIRQKLLQLREERLLGLRHKLAEAAELRDEGVADFTDQGLGDDLRGLLHLLGDQQREEILAIDATLAALDAGRYGRCQECGTEIPAARLELRPWARWCVACKSARERDAEQRGGHGHPTL